MPNKGWQLMVWSSVGHYWLLKVHRGVVAYVAVQYGQLKVNITGVRVPTAQNLARLDPQLEIHRLTQSV